MRSVSIANGRFIIPLLSYAAAVAITAAACGGGASSPSPACNDSTTWLTETGATTGTVVVTASGTICGDDPQEVVVVRQPSETETIGQQIQRARYAVIGSVEPGEFDIRITIGPVVRLRDGTELRPASDPFQVAFR